MSNNNIQIETENLTTVQSQIITLKKNLFELRLKKVQGEKVNPHEFKKQKHLISQLSYYETRIRNSTK